MKKEVEIWSVSFLSSKFRPLFIFRTSFDWDIWARDPRAFTEYASQNGFLVDKESCAPHEFSKLFCAENEKIMIEVHQSFPNISLPTELLCRDSTTRVG